MLRPRMCLESGIDELWIESLDLVRSDSDSWALGSYVCCSFFFLVHTDRIRSIKHTLHRSIPTLPIIIMADGIPSGKT